MLNSNNCVFKVNLAIEVPLVNKDQRAALVILDLPERRVFKAFEAWLEELDHKENQVHKENAVFLDLMEKLVKLDPKVC